MADVQAIRPLDPADALFRSFLEKGRPGRCRLHALRPGIAAVAIRLGKLHIYGHERPELDVGHRVCKSLDPTPIAGGRVLIDHAELHEIVAKRCRVDEEHLHHIPLAKLEEPILLAPVPDGQGYAVIDGSHRATVRVRACRDVYAVLLTAAESMLAIEVAPLAMHRTRAAASGSPPTRSTGPLSAGPVLPAVLTDWTDQFVVR